MLITMNNEWMIDQQIQTLMFVQSQSLSLMTSEETDLYD